MTRNIYYKQSDITASLSELMVSPWALECDSTRAAGIQEALHLIQDMINGEVPENMKIPVADVVEVVRCKDCVNCYPQNKYDGDKTVWCAVREVPTKPLCSCDYPKHRIES